MAGGEDVIEEVIEEVVEVVDQAPTYHKLPMPRFSGDSTGLSEGSIVARTFLARFVAWARVSNLSADMTAKSFSYALTGSADLWFQSTSRNDRVDVDDWEELMTAFSARFIKPVSPRYIDAEIAKLPQRAGESVAAFVDRCELAQSLLDETWSVPQTDVDREGLSE